MIHPTSLPSLGTLISVAYAGTNMPVHIVCESKDGILTSWKLNYASFSRILRERANRKWTILLLEAFRQCQTMDANGLLKWNLIQVKSILESGLPLDTQASSNCTSPLQCAA